MKNKSQLFKGISVAFCVFLVLSACSSNNNKNEPDNQSNIATNMEKPEEQLPHVELVWHYGQGAIQGDMHLIEDEINKITEKKINATIKHKQEVWGDYAQKMNAVVASGEQADIIFTSNWNFDYLQNQAKGAFAPLNDLIDKYGISIMETLPKYALEATKVDGHIYAVPNNQYYGGKEGLVIRKDYADKYKLDVNNLKELADLEPFLQQVKAGESDDMIPVVLDRKGRFSLGANYFDLELIGNVGAISIDDPAKVVNVFESDDYKNYLNLMRKWYTAGYINEDAATVKNLSDLIRTGKVISVFYNISPDADTRQKVINGGHDVIAVPLRESSYVSTAGVLNAMFAIGANSKNKERAMMFLDLLHSDKELNHLLNYGLEGKHYSKINDTTIKKIDNSGYAQPGYWLFGNTNNRYLLEGEKPGIIEESIKENETAAVSPILGFNFNIGSVSAEIANIASLIDQYRPGLETGTVDPNAGLPEFLDKLNKAGAQKVIAEIQTQLDNWINKK